MVSKASSFTAFPVDHSRLNPHFEAYKLATSSSSGGEAPSIASHRLPSSATLEGSEEHPDGTLLGFRELRDLQNTQILVPGSLPGHAAYIDDAGFVVLIVIDERRQPSFHPLCSLNGVKSGREGSADVIPLRASLLALPSGRWIVANGLGQLVILHTSLRGRRWSATEMHRTQVLQGGMLLPHRLLEIELDEASKIYKVLLQSIRRPAQSQSGGPASSSNSRSKVVFDISFIELPLETSEATDTEPRAVSPKWTVTGQDAAYYSYLTPNGACLIGEEHFEDVKKPVSSLPLSESVAQPAEGASRGGRDTAARAPDVSTFSWLQTPDSLTIVFQLPPQLSKTHFRIHFSPQGLSLSLAASAIEALPISQGSVTEIDDIHPSGPSGDVDDPLLRTFHKINSGQFRSRSLWAPIDPSTSVWTWEKIDTPSRKGVPIKGLLSLHLEKKDEGTRWTKVFEKRKRSISNIETSVKTARPMIGGGHSVTRQSEIERLQQQALKDEQEMGYDEPETDEEEEEEEEPLETVDPSELLGMIQGLDKYTADEGDTPSIDASGPQLQRESLLNDPLEPEDATVGRRLCRTTILHDGASESSIQVQHGSAADEALYVLASPLPSAQNSKRPPLAIRRDLDGLVFLPPCSDPSSSSSMPEFARNRPPQQWQHTSTLPALSYVLASKRDLSRVYVSLLHSTSRSRRDLSSAIAPANQSVVYAFENPPLTCHQDESGSGSKTPKRSAGNLFVYSSPPPSSSVGKGRGSRYAESRVIRLMAPPEKTQEEKINGVNGREEEEEETGNLISVCSAHLPRPRLRHRQEKEKDDVVDLSTPAVLVSEVQCQSDGDGLGAGAEVQGGKEEGEKEGEEEEEEEEEVLLCLCTHRLLVLRPFS